MGELVVEAHVSLEYRNEAGLSIARLEVCVVEEPLPTAREYNRTCSKSATLNVRSQLLTL